jgi:hypothetical protein
MVRPSPIGLAVLGAGIGLLLYAVALSKAPRAYDAGLALFWVALVLPFALFSYLLFMGRLTGRERVVIVAIAGVLPTVCYRAKDLMQFTGFDELLHQRTLADLAGGAGPFAVNPMLPVSPYFPGLEGLTVLLVRLTGMPVLAAASVVVVTCRLLLVLTIYQATMELTGSDFQGSVVVLMYACCPQFFSFNSQFAYQTLALTLGVGSLLVLRRAQIATGPNRRRLVGAAVLGMGATGVTHHVTSWMVLIFLLLWAGGSRGRDRRVLLAGAAGALLLLVVWSATIYRLLLDYFLPVFVQAGQGMRSVLGGGSSQRQLFADTSGVQTPVPEQAILVFYALVCTATAVMSGLILLRDGWRTRSLAWSILGVLALAYPATLAGRFVPAAADLGDRLSTFLFLPLALAAAGVMDRYIMSRPVRFRPSWIPPAAVVTILVTMTVSYLGGIILGAGADWSRLPGPYLVEADYRSADAETRAAVRWAGEHLPVGSRIIADRYPSALITGTTRLYPVAEPERGFEPAGVYFSSTWSLGLTNVVRGLHVRYLYVDQRLADDLPRFGVYFYPGETQTMRRMSRAGLAKFPTVRGLQVVYRHGPVTIYETAGLGVQEERSGWVGSPRELGVRADLFLGTLVAIAAYAAWRRRLGWELIRAAGVVPTSIVVMAVMVFAGLAMAWLRVVPGPWLTVDALLTTVVLMLSHGALRPPRLRLRRPIRYKDVYIIAGIMLALVGLFGAWQRSWLVNVIEVQHVLAQAITSAGGLP